MACMSTEFGCLLIMGFVCYLLAFFNLINKRIMLREKSFQLMMSQEGEGGSKTKLRTLIRKF